MTRIPRSTFQPRYIAAAVATAVGLQASPSIAQKLEETIVTATKRESSLQDVAISVIAMDGATIQENSIGEMSEFANNIPSLSVGKNPISNSIYIRGIGSGANQGIEQSVSIFHDGVYMGRHQLSRVPFMDIERVEVLRGPQSILFGKNTIGGLLSVITAKPSDEFEGSVSALYGWDENEKEVNAVISGPITDSLNGRLSYRGYETDGYIENVVTGEDGPAQDDWTLRGQLDWAASDNILVNFKWESSEFETGQQATQLAVFNPLTPSAEFFADLNEALVGGPEKYDDERAVANDGGVSLAAYDPKWAGIPGFPDSQDGAKTEVDLGTLRIDWTLGEHTLTSITGYVHYKSQIICDCDFSALPMISADGREDYDQWSQELRLASPTGGTLEYMAGLYYHSAELEYRAIETFGTNILGVPNFGRDYGMDQDQDQWAAFGSLTWNISDATRATFGLRYSDENKEAQQKLEKRFSGGWNFGEPNEYGSTPTEYDRFEIEMADSGLPNFYNAAIWEGALGTWEHDLDEGRDESFATWSVALQHDLSDFTMIYASAATGFKGGGFDARFLQESLEDGFEFEDEEAINYELGIKSELLDGAMRVNATAFFTKVDDLQMSVFDGSTGFLVTNAAEMEAKGVEFEGQWAATTALTFGLAATYLDNEFVDFPNSPCWASQEVADPEGCTEGKDVSGESNTYSPEWAYSANADFVLPVGSKLEARAWVNVNYSDGYFTGADLDPEIAYQKPWTRVDARLSLGTDDGSWEIALIGKNLTNEKVGNTHDDQPLVPANGFKLLDRLRSYAIQAIYRF